MDMYANERKFRRMSQNLKISDEIWVIRQDLRIVIKTIRKSVGQNRIDDCKLGTVDNMSLNFYRDFPKKLKSEVC